MERGMTVVVAVNDPGRPSLELPLPSFHRFQSTVFARTPAAIFPQVSVYCVRSNSRCHLSTRLDVSNFVFCNKSLPLEARAKDLVDRMSLSEKTQQLGNSAAGVPRLGLPSYEWWSEALHGVTSSGRGTHFDQAVPGGTSFPTVILSAASFNASLWKNMGQVVSTEARALYNLGRAGLTYWSPNINVIRDPRWGRVMETPGEDPFVVGTYAVNYVRGLQDIEGQENPKDLNSRPLKVSSCCKHYAAYDVDHWYGVDRRGFDARVAEQDMLETFLRPFEMCVKEGDASCVMCSFNKINGIPACADPRLLKETIRGDWGLRGYIVSDCDSVQVIVENNKWLGDSPEGGVAQAMKAGLDLDCGWPYLSYYSNYTLNATKIGRIKEADIDKALINLYVLLMRVGYFDGSPSFKSLGKDDICADVHIELAAQAAREGIVLLKNDNATLPLSSNTFKNLALVGPHANATEVMIGNYAGPACRYISPIDGFSAFAKVQYAMGCADVACASGSLMTPAMDLAKNADATIIIVGLDLSIEAEGRDRVDFFLPGHQTHLVNEVANVAKGPVILVVMASGTIDISFAKDNPKIKAILWVGYPGQEGGRAIADVVYGKYNPGGKLPVTWYPADYVDQLPLTSMQLRPDDELGYPGRTYKFYNGSTVYPFGYGLSYTQFMHQITTKVNSIDVKLKSRQYCRDLSYEEGEYTTPQCAAVLVSDMSCDKQFEFEVDVEVRNTGSVDGSDVVIVYSRPPRGVARTHSKQVIGFERVFVPKGQTQNVKFVFNACKSLMVVERNGYSLLPSGIHSIIVNDDEASTPIQVNIH
ncbi:PREDICTED: probable beta-D-xylosidase 2 [Nelumbo nucifera]|uniref:Probable beta-D-xylosidase 2 n=1 Tax=Nelumbo nucifera TaxID=4432 RepID=A0A1U8Q9S0_NELNU|nr:PREDICTED: probable beta-D-xylosidase 2 [Nelumbo nucifera]